MKYILIDDLGVDLFTEEYDEKDKAIAAAEKEWDRLSAADKKRRVAFYVLEFANPDEDAEDHLDGDTIFTIFEIK